MNTLKPLLIFAALVGVCYGVYSRINHKNDVSPEGANAWDGNLSVETGDNGPGSIGQSLPGMGPAPIGGAPMMGSSTAGDQFANRDPNAHHDQYAGRDPYGNPGAPGHDPRGQQDFGPPAAAAGGEWHGANGAGPPGQPGASGADYNAGVGPVSYDPNAGAAGIGVGGAGAASGSYGVAADPYGQPSDPLADPGRGRGGAASSAFAAAFEQAKRELEAGRLPEAHYQLSRWFDEPSLSPTEQQQLTDLLDQLAGTVIYSTQNLLEPACEVQPGETLERIAQRYNVPWQLLAKINGIDDPHSLRPGERLKVVRGPFNAEISLDKRMLTLKLDSTYAGRFPIGLGRDHVPVEGQYVVTEKTVDPVYHGAGRTYERGDRENPLGHRWLGLGHDIGIHGTQDPRYAGRTDLAGSINLSERDVDDVFDILGEGSKVVIRR